MNEVVNRDGVQPNASRPRQLHHVQAIPSEKHVAYALHSLHAVIDRRGERGDMSRMDEEAFTCGEIALNDFPVDGYETRSVTVEMRKYETISAEEPTDVQRGFDAELDLILCTEKCVALYDNPAVFLVVNRENVTRKACGKLHGFLASLRLKVVEEETIAAEGASKHSANAAGRARFHSDARRHGEKASCLRKHDFSGLKANLEHLHR